MYNKVSVSKSLTMPSLQPQAMRLLQQLMDDAPVTYTKTSMMRIGLETINPYVTLTSTHFVSAR